MNDLFANDMKSRVIEEWTNFINDGKDFWQSDPEMLEMYEDDFVDGMGVIEAAFSKGAEEAYQKLRNMDTAPREHVWEILEKHGYKFD